MRTFSSISRRVIFWWDDDDDVHFVLVQHAQLDFHSASSLKQQFTDRYIASPGTIILIPSQPDFALTALIGKGTITNLIIFCLTRPALEPTIYPTQGKKHYTTDAVDQNKEVTLCRLYNSWQQLIYTIYTNCSNRACAQYRDFVEETQLLTQKILKQGCVAPWLKSSMQKIYRRHHELVDLYWYPFLKW